MASYVPARSSLPPSIVVRSLLDLRKEAYWESAAKESRSLYTVGTMAILVGSAGTTILAGDAGTTTFDGGEGEGKELRGRVED
ncbi:unnamed protein product [Linum trigynum]|uniref:Uncharacterized protein n=1 Tax=Linum trigynum TaxID=586398 RepID=A0AAV2F9W4_9ROSI